MGKTLIAGVFLCVGASVGADEISMIATDLYSPASSFNTGTNWADHAAPVAGNTYKTGANSMRTPADNNLTTNYVFAGDRLTLSQNGGILWKTGGLTTIYDFVMDGGGITHGNDNFAARIAGTVTVTRASSFIAGEPNARDFIIYSTVKGSSDLTLLLAATNTSKQVSLMADNSGFTGRLILRGAGKLSIASEACLGGNPASFTANQLDFAGTTLYVTNSLTLDDPNRGLVLNRWVPSLVTSSSTGGVFEVANSATATVACVISGADSLVKRGNGTLVLATNNTYTGLTTVESGTLRLTAGALGATCSAVVTGATSVIAGEGSLSNVTLVAGGLLAAEKGGWSIRSLAVQNTTNVTFALDLSQASPDTTLIRVSGALTKAPFQVFQFAVNTNSAIETPYKVLSASNLADYAACDFCVTPPWIGELSQTNDGGGLTLLFTPTPPAKIQFKTASDAFGFSGFTTTNWTDLLSPSAEKTYVSRAFEMRLPPSGNNTFPGKRLIFDNAQNISLKGTDGTATIADLTVMNNASFGLTEPLASRLAGNIRLHPILDAGRSYSLFINGWSNLRSLYLFSTLSGYGDIYLSGTGDPSAGSSLYMLTAANTNFFGRINMTGNTNFWMRIAGEPNLGGVPPAFRADQLTFNGGGISVTNDVTLDDVTRGITLLATGGTAGTTTDTGSFTNGTPAELRRYEGGCVMRPESNTVTLTVTCPITGAGTLIKNGAGTLVLGGANSYTGQTQIIAGALRPDSTNAFGTGPVLVKNGGALLRRYPDANLPDGVALGSAITFESGSHVDIVLNAGFTVTGNITVPLFTVPSGVSVDPASVPVRHSLKNFKATVITSALGSRTQVSAQLVFQGTVVTVK
jgi:autotransporter-associated beta strand protein